MLSVRRMTEPVPALVTVHLWRVPVRNVPAALGRVAIDRRRVCALPGVRFAKVLGTGSGRTFTPRDAQPRRWGLLTTWADVAAAAAFERSGPGRGWARIADEACRLELRPLTARGRWSGRQPFGMPEGVHHVGWDGPVAAVTRARLAVRRTAAFRRAVPAVAADLRDRPGLRLALGIGELPVGLQGTLSLWDSATALRAFAYHGAPHRAAVDRTPTEGWYTEELFARFAVLSASGTVDGEGLLP